MMAFKPDSSDHGPNASLSKIPRLLPKLGQVTRITNRQILLHSCIIIRNFEPIHYYVMKCMSKEIAIPYMVLQALNIELSRTRNVVTVSNPNLVRGKYTFWRSVVNGQETDHPIGAALLEIIRERNIPRDCLISIIDAKVQSCEDDSLNMFHRKQTALELHLILSIYSKNITVQLMARYWRHYPDQSIPQFPSRWWKVSAPSAWLKAFIGFFAILHTPGLPDLIPDSLSTW